MKDYRIFAALSYFSIFFAGFIFPLAVYFIVQDDEVKHHAKRALISHILPFLTFIIVVFGMISGSTGSVIGSMILFMILNFFIVIWNVIQGIKVLM
ncbi:DUF4870 domain-containing protein [Tepidibacillus infernus]|uniref:DUF4870 domain-containing protein n=1 Tax=Tepidibacillus infernus TaxID=1806172 RepID=UPI003B73C632